MSSAWFQILAAAGSLLGWFCVVRIGEARGFDLRAFRLQWAQLALALAALASLVIHEAGHWTAARAVGWRCLYVRIGPYKLVQ